MSGDLIHRLTSRSFDDDAAMAAARNDPRLPLQMLNIGDAVDATLADHESERQGMNLDIAVQIFRRRIEAEGFRPDRRDAMIDAGRASITRAQPILESAIERAMLPWLVFGNYGMGSSPLPVCLPDEDAPRYAPIFIAPQMRFGRYRLDFALVARSRSRSLIVAVECDGAAFHDRRSDLRRDAFLAGFRFPAVRATGSEIRTDPRPVIGRIAAIVAAWNDMEAGR